MKAQQYKIEDIYKTLENIEYSNPKLKRISMDQLEKAIKITRTPVIYNVEDIIERLQDYIHKHEKHHEHLFCREKELCKIIGVKKLALHQWRKRGLIEYEVLGTRMINYKLRTILHDFESIKDGRLSITIEKL